MARAQPELRDEGVMRPGWWRKPRGGAGWLAMAGITTGILTWWPISLGAGAGWFALVMLGYRRSALANAYLDRAFPGAVRDARHTLGNELRGSLGDTPFVIRNGLDTMHVLIGTPIEAITIDRVSNYQGIGDPEFDAQFSVFGTDATGELLWRILLVAEVRAELCAIFAGYSVVFADGWFDVVVDDDEADGPAIEQMVRRTSTLAAAMYTRWTLVDADDPLSWFVERIPQEPMASVRKTHFEWLVTGGYEVPAVLLLAAKDPDPEIQRWAQEQRPADSEYR